MRISSALVLAAAVAGRASGCTDLVRDCGAVADNYTDNAGSFAVCQRIATGPGGPGCVRVPQGTYAVSSAVLNTSHIAYELDTGVTITAWHGIRTSTTIFLIGPEKHSLDVPHIVNVTIRGPAGGAFTVDTSKALFSPWHVVPFAFTGWVEGMTVANVVIKMADPSRDPAARYATQNPGINFNYLTVDSERKHPTDGYFANITSTGGIWGYGMVQVRSAENLVFENLDGTGGVTLRLETGGGGLEYVNNVTGRNIVCRKGHAAFMAEPHTQRNGVFRVSNLTSYGCSIGAEMNGGYEENGLPPGWFSNASTVSGLVGYYDPPGFAQANRSLSNADACAVCGNENVPINYHVALTGVQAVGFPPPANRTACAFWIRWKACPFG